MADQVQTPDPQQIPPAQNPPPEPDRLGKIEQAIAMLAESQKQLNETAQKLMQGPSPEARYLSELEQNRTPPQQTDFNLMDNAELVRTLEEKHQRDLSIMAAQFGQMLKATNPNWDGWKFKEAIGGLMSQGLPFEQAYSKVKELSLTTAKESAGGNEEERIKKEVETRLAAIDQRRRASRASAAEKPGSSGTPGPKLNHIEQFNQDWEDYVEEGKEIPAELTRGLR